MIKREIRNYLKRGSIVRKVCLRILTDWGLVSRKDRASRMHPDFGTK